MGLWTVLKATKALLVLISIAGVAGIYVTAPPAFLAATGGYSAQNRPPRDTMVPVLVAPAGVADVPVFFEGIGTVKPLNSVTVRPQIDGKITDIAFTEGAEVKKGDLLARLDPVTVQAQVAQAEAKKALDEALVANTAHDLDRFTKAGTLAVSQQQLDTQKALVAQQRAQVRADQAALASVQALLGYAAVTAPISGRTGLRMVDVGNVVRGQTDGLVVIAQIEPIAVIFTLPQQQLSGVSGGMAGGPLTAEALTTDGTTVLETGTLTVIDNLVDSATGTVKLKAEFPNATRHLWPGQFVTVRLQVDILKHVVVVPTAAIQHGPAGTFVYAASADNTVSIRTVTMGRQDDERSVIISGLAAGETVVTTGFSRLKEGARISVGGRPAEAPPPTAPDSKGGGAPMPVASGSVLADPASAAESSSSAVDGTVGSAGDGKKSGKHKHRKGVGAGDPPAAAGSGAGAAGAAP